MLVAVATLLACAGCGGGGDEDPASNGPNGAEPTEVVGLITKISRSGNRIEEFTVAGENGTHVVAVDPAIDYGFDLEHLEEHRRTKDPVRCSVETRDDRLFATAILDA